MSQTCPYRIAFRGWPGTVRFRVPEAEGGPAHGYRIVPFYLTPLVRQTIEVVVRVSLICIVLVCTGTLMEGTTDQEISMATQVLFASLLLAWPVQALASIVFTSAIVVEMRPDEVSVLGWLGERRYGRNVPITFELHRHWKLRRAMIYDEQPPKRLLEAYHLVMRYGFEAQILATLHGERRARKLLDRLNGCFMATAPGFENAALEGAEHQYGHDADF